MTTPTSQVRAGLVSAHLEILRPSVDNPVIPFCFNPTQYQLAKKNNFAEIGIPGLESPPLQFVRGEAETLTAELLFDTSDTLDDVRDKYTDRLRHLMQLSEELHAPAILRFVWGKQFFVGVLDSLNATYELFTPEGVPLRATANVTMKEYRPAAVQFKESRTSSPDYDKVWIVKRGEALASIASAVYQDAARWRDIARHNAIVDPRQVAVGTVLRLPRLR